MIRQKQKKGFTLVELLIVIAIIGILTSIVLVSTRGGIDKSKRASALTSASSALPEIVACQDDGGNLSAYNISSNICSAAGHSTKWPSMGTTGYTFGSTAQTNIPDTYNFTITSPSGSSYPNIKCSLDTSMCCDVGSVGC